jgi:hypothetical protein
MTPRSTRSLDSHLCIGSNQADGFLAETFDGGQCT